MCDYLVQFYGQIFCTSVFSPSTKIFSKKTYIKADNMNSKIIWSFANCLTSSQEQSPRPIKTALEKYYNFTVRARDND